MTKVLSLIDKFGNPLKKDNGTTSTATTTVEEKTEPTKKEEDEPLFIQTPIFILFAEYLGYVSGCLEIAENWCNPSKPMPTKSIQTFLEREARSLYDQMLEEWNEQEIHKLYLNFYQCGLDELETDLIEKRKKCGDNLFK